MKKQVKILILSILIILASTLTVNAADATANLSLSSTEVKKGDTFTVTLNVACEEGINGLEGKVSYDEETLELESIDVGDANWSNLGEGLDFAILHAKSGTITTADILKITFKVKDTAEVGTKAKVTLSNIVLDSDASANSTKEIGTKEVEVSIVEEYTTETPQGKQLSNISITKAPEKTTYPTGEKFDKTGMIVTATYSDGTSKEITNYTYAPADVLKLIDTKVTITYTEGGITKTVDQAITVVAGDQDNESENNNTEDKNTEDNTQADKEIDKAGLQNYAFAIITIMVLVIFISYKKYKQYKNI